LSRYSFPRFMMVIYPDKSVVCKDKLPDGFISAHRPAATLYKQVLGDKVLDAYDVLNGVDEIFYKTDTHLNLKGNVLVYNAFLSKLRETYGVDVVAREVELKRRECELNTLPYGMGDLLWKTNLGDQVVPTHLDVYYSSPQIEPIYQTHVLSFLRGRIRLLDYALFDMTETFHGATLSWDIISNHILCQCNPGKNYTVVIFYDSFLLNVMDLYLAMFQRVFLIKNVYNPALIQQLSPDFVFEFRVERFLC